MIGTAITADIDREICLAEARIPGNPHIATRWRWKTKGIRRSGRVVKLKTITVGSRCFTTQRWVNEFIAQCSDSASEPATEPATDFARRATEENRALQAILG